MDYSKMTDDEFTRILTDVVSGMTASEILLTGDVYPHLADALNNTVLDIWAADHEELEA